MRTIDKGTNWGRRSRMYGAVALILGLIWVLVENGLS